MSDEDEVFLFNPLPWDREISGPIPGHVLSARGGDDDQTAGRHYQDRDPIHPPLATQDDVDYNPGLYGSSAVLLEPTMVPGYGFVVASSDALASQDNIKESERGSIETDRYDVTFDRDRGGITSLYDKTLEYEWVDEDAEHPIGGFVHEEVADRDTSKPRQRLFQWPSDEWHDAAIGLGDNPSGFQSDWYARQTIPESVRQHRVYETPFGYDVRQELVVPALPSDVTLRMVFPRDGDEIVVDAQWDMGLETHPESTYLMFPFSLDDPTPRFDVGGEAVQIDEDQLPESVQDYVTVQKWAALDNDDRGMVVGCPLNPMVQFGDARFGDDERSLSLDRGHLRGWITNNYWDTNFRAHQPGVVQARYHLVPHDGAFDESFAHQRGSEAELWEPLAQTAGETPVSEPPLESAGQLLDLPSPPTLVQQVRPTGGDEGGTWPGYATTGDAESADMLVLLKNASDERRTATIGSAALNIAEAERRTPLGGPTEGDLLIADGLVNVDLDPRETVAVALECSP